jgi:hypothetical protein
VESRAEREGLLGEDDTGAVAVNVSDTSYRQTPPSAIRVVLQPSGPEVRSHAQVLPRRLSRNRRETPNSRSPHR